MTTAPPPSLKISVTTGKVAARVGSSGQLEAFRNVSVSHVNSKRDPGTEISAREASLRRGGSAKNKRILVKMEITVSQSASRKLLKYRRVFPFSKKTRSEVCPDVL